MNVSKLSKNLSRSKDRSIEIYTEFLHDFTLCDRSEEFQFFRKTFGPYMMAESNIICEEFHYLLPISYTMDVGWCIRLKYALEDSRVCRDTIKLINNFNRYIPSKNRLYFSLISDFSSRDIAYAPLESVNTLEFLLDPECYGPTKFNGGVQDAISKRIVRYTSGNNNDQPIPLTDLDDVDMLSVMYNLLTEKGYLSRLCRSKVYIPCCKIPINSNDAYRENTLRKTSQIFVSDAHQESITKEELKAICFSALSSVIYSCCLEAFNISTRIVLDKNKVLDILKEFLEEFVAKYNSEDVVDEEFFVIVKARRIVVNSKFYDSPVVAAQIALQLLKILNNDYIGGIVYIPLNSPKYAQHYSLMSFLSYLNDSFAWKIRNETLNTEHKL